jgi:undecaprenyl-diphosphatase
MAVDRRRRRRWRRALVTVGGTYALNTAIKGVFRRKRPALEDLPALIATPTALSFPSAHASSSFAAARAYSGLLPAAPLYATATAMALSRVYLGVHYPTDIAAGAVLGTLTGSAAR